MKRMARFSFQHRRIVVAGWLLSAVIVLSSAGGSKFNDSFNLPGTDSQAAVSLLTKNFPAASGEGDQVVFQASHGTTIRSPSIRAAATAALAKAAKVPGAGLSYEAAAAQAVNTSGRTVLFAGITVCIALLGQFALGVSFLHGLSIASAIAVALTMATSLTFLPAMLGFLGPKVLSRRERQALTAHGPVAPQRPRASG